MRRITFEYDQIVDGIDATQVYYDTLNKAHPDLGLTRANSKIILIQGFGNIDAPSDTIVRISVNETPWVIHDIIHNRFNLASVVPTPTFTDAELPIVTALPNSVHLVEFMSAKFNRPFTADAIWTENYGIPDAGGTSGYNWYMRAVSNSMFWFGDKIVYLHPML